MAAVALLGMSEHGRQTAHSWIPQRERNPSPKGAPGQNLLLRESSRSEAAFEPGSQAHNVPSLNKVPEMRGEPGRASLAADQAALTDLARRCQCGELGAWEELARTQHRRVYAICYRFTGSATDAEDLTQDVFIKVFRNLASFDPAKGAFGTWMTSLARNLLVDHYRRARMERVTDSLDSPAEGQEDGPSRAERLVDGHRNQYEHVAGMELRSQIQSALAQVSPELREAVILRDLQDMDYREIAEVLGVPQGTVKSRISRGRAELARLLKRLEGQVI